MSHKNEMIEKQLVHKTIREFKDESIPIGIFDKIIEVARRTASSNGMQSCSIIRVTDPMIKLKIADVCRQEYVARAPELLIYIVDLYRNTKIANEQGSFLESSYDMDWFFQGFTDTCITAQNILNAAESMDLGVFYLGSILNDSAKICEILNLPKYTFPVVGMGIGYPNQNPQLKPRMDMRLRVFENEYTIFESYLEAIKDYDVEMQTYYDLRNANKRVDSFSNQVVSKFQNVMPKRQEILNIIHDQGFDLKIK